MSFKNFWGQMLFLTNWPLSQWFKKIFLKSDLKKNMWPFKYYFILNSLFSSTVKYLIVLVYLIELITLI